MKKPVFKLARLARVRQAQEQIALAKWQTVENRVREALALERSTAALIATSIAELAEAQGCAVLDPGHILQARSTIEMLEQRLEAQEQLTRAIQAEADELRRPWQALRTELEGLKRLEEKALTAFRVGREREEGKQNDEVATERARRNNFPLSHGRD